MFARSKGLAMSNQLHASHRLFVILHSRLQIPFHSTFRKHKRLNPYLTNLMLDPQSKGEGDNLLNKLFSTRLYYLFQQQEKLYTQQQNNSDTLYLATKTILDHQSVESSANKTIFCTVHWLCLPSSYIIVHVDTNNRPTPK